MAGGPARSALPLADGTRIVESWMLGGEPLWDSAAVTLPALEIAPPFGFWGRREVALDLWQHAVYTVAAGLGRDGPTLQSVTFPSSGAHIRPLLSHTRPKRTEEGRR